MARERRLGGVALLVILSACLFDAYLWVRPEEAGSCTPSGTATTNPVATVLLVFGLLAVSGGATLIATRHGRYQLWRFVAAGVGFCVLLVNVIWFLGAVFASSFSCGGFM